MQRKNKKRIKERTKQTEKKMEQRIGEDKEEEGNSNKKNQDMMITNEMENNFKASDTMSKIAV